jgi:transposase-like protein
MIIYLTNPLAFWYLLAITISSQEGGQMAEQFFKKAILSREDEAYGFLEQIRWPNGPICPHCQGTKIYRFKIVPNKRRVLKCATCRKQFSVTVGTIFEDSHIPLTKWITAMHFLCSSKKGMSTHQLHRMLDITYKSAWFMTHRIRHAFKESFPGTPLSGTVEADETYVGGRARREQKMENKTAVFALVERGGRVRSFPVERVTAENLKAIIKSTVAPTSKLMTDEFVSYQGLKKDFADHQTVNHSIGEYVRGEAGTNTVEGYFSLLKRGLNGTYHHVAQKHLHRYLAEFDFRYNARGVDDTTRAVLALQRIEGRRLRYR